MALDRQSIEKRDFPIARRGYDPEAVDAHLSTIADEIEGLKRGGRGGGTGLAAAASEQVRLIVEAAEQSATEIEREAEYEAAQIRQDAREDADRLVAEAEAKAQQHVNAVSTAATAMLERIASMERETGQLFDALRQGANRLTADLALVQGGVGDLRGGGTGGAEPQPPSTAAPVVPADPAPPVAAPATEAYDAGDEIEPPAGDAVAPAPAPAPAPRRRRDTEQDDDTATSSGGGPDEEGARLIALNMALNGTPREETERYLADNFDLTDTEALLDDVYARAGG